MKNLRETVGVDVSKSTIDVHLYVNNLHSTFDNNPKGFRAMLKLIKKCGIKANEVFFCFEHTGMYSITLAAFLSEKNTLFVMVPGLEIKRSIGMARGKDDKVDAKRIAEFAHMRRDKLEPITLPSKEVLKIKHLLSLRERMVKQKAGYQASVKEYKAALDPKDAKVLFDTQAKLLSELKKQIKKVEKEILDTLKSDETLSKLYELVTSVKGIGLVIGSYLLTTTNCFTAFDNARKYACYAGIAPFPYRSGSSINGKTKVNHLANKTIKTLLIMAASTARQHDPELKQYYEKRLKEGKNKMSTINVIKNKLIHRVFAVVKRKSPYVVLRKHAA